MADWNDYAAYGYGPDVYGGPRMGGLGGLLQDVMLQHGLLQPVGQQQGWLQPVAQQHPGMGGGQVTHPSTGIGPVPNGPPPNFDRNPAPAPVWDPSRPFADPMPPPPSAPPPQHPVPSNDGVSSLARQDPDFPRLVRVPANDPPDQRGYPDLPDDKSSSPDETAISPTTPALSSRSEYPDQSYRDVFRMDGSTFGGGYGGGRGGGGGGGGGDKYTRCNAAITDDVEDWYAFCRTLPQGGRSKTAGGETPRRACWSKAEQSADSKRRWCQNEYGKND